MLPTLSNTANKNQRNPIANQHNAFFEILSIQEWLHTAQEQKQIHAHAHFELVWAVKGNGSLQIDMHTYPLAGNMLFCIVPNQLHALEADHTTEGYIIRFNEAFLPAEKRSAPGSFHPTLPVFMQQPFAVYEQDTCHELLDIVQKLMKEYNSTRLFKTEILSRYLNILFLYMLQAVPAENLSHSHTQNTRLVKKFMELVDIHYKTNKRVSEYADLMLVTPNYLNETIKKITGNTAGHHIRQRIVLEAKRQAAYSDDSMKEVAWNLGFSDIAHFSKLFKKVTGNNFTDYKRSRMLQWAMA